MATQLQIRRGTSAQVAAFTGAEGEVVVNTTNDSIHVNDGSTAGGFELARVDGSNWAITNAISTTANISFGDNDKAIFGSGGDLQIYHDGSHSYVSDQGTGNLRVLAENFQVRNPANNEAMIIAIPDSGVTLYHNNAAKLATTSTGIDVTGTVVSDGATIDGTLELNSNSFKHTALTPSYNFIESDVTGENTQFLQASGTLRIRTVDDSVANPVERFRIDHGTGDISFYNSSGTSQSLHWDSSAESLGIGVSNPSSTIDVVSSGTNSQLISEFSSASGLRARIATDASDDAYMYLYNGSGSNTVSFRTDGNDSFINGGGNFGIGTSSPVTLKSSTTLQVDGNAKLGDDNGRGLLSLGDIASTGANAGIWRGAAGAYAGTGNFLNLGGYDGITFTTGNADISSQTERMRIDSSGNFLVNRSGTFTTAKMEIQSDAGDASTLALNSIDTDGSILEFYKAGTAVGSIFSHSSGNMGIGTGATGVLFAATSNSIQPWNPSSNAARDAAQDLGTSGNRFKDLYLSGGAYLGGTGSANKLDDYEEGTWTPEYEATTAFTSITYNSVTYGKYTRVGNLVHIQGIIRTDSISGGSGNVTLAGLPFTVGAAQFSSISLGYVSSFTGDSPGGMYVIGNGTSVSIRYRTTANGGLNNSLAVADLGTGANKNYIAFGGTYITAA